MKHIQVNDEWLYNHMPVVDSAIIKELEGECDTIYSFSKKFEKRMQGLIWKEAHPWINIILSVSKRAAIFLICIVSALFVVTMSVEAYRNKFFETIKTILEDSISYFYFSDVEIQEFLNKEPKYIPKGYKDIHRVSTNKLLSITYENSLGEQIVYDQMLIEDGANIIVDSEYDNQELIIVNGVAVTLFLYHDNYICAYCEHKEYVHVITADNLDIKEIYAMFESFIEE